MAPRRPLLLLLLLLVFSSYLTPETEARVSILLEGFVQRADGSPLENVSIRLWGFNLEGETGTDEGGYYTLTATTDEPVCTLYALYDDPHSPGVDLLPTAHYIDTRSDVKKWVNFTLVPAATVVVMGQLRPVELAKIVRGCSFKVIEPESRDTLRYDDYSLIYGTGTNVQNFYLGLESSMIVVPADMPFAITVSSAYQYERTRGRRSWYGWYLSRQRVDAFTEFDMVEGDRFLLEEGELMELDVRRYSLRSDLYRVENLLEALSANLTAVEEKGFYLTSERRDLQGASDLTASASSKLESSQYEEAYIDLRKAYLEAAGLQNRLSTVTMEALVSVNFLVAFVAVTAVASASLLTGDTVKKLAVAAVLYTPLLLYIYEVYPGSFIVSQLWFLTVGVVSVSVALFVTIVSPLVFKDVRRGRGVAKIGGIVTVFSMATRNLKRRGLRTVLILVSILALTMGFVALTSLSTGYGLIYNRVPSNRPGASGILIRLTEYTPKRVIEEGWFYPLNYMIADWASGHEGVAGLALKAQNRPEQGPWTSIDGQPILGVIGVQPESEPLMEAIDDSVVYGDLLREEGTCLISNELLQRPDVNIGDIVTIRGVELRIVGAFNEGIEGIMDIDGESILPTYQINLMPEARVPVLEAITCEASTVVVTTLDSAIKIRYVFVSRIYVEFDPRADAETLAKSMALSRECRVWVSEGGKVYLAYMGGILGGKGLPILIPWAIVILNVIATMVNAMYERKDEIAVLSSIGLNPLHISGVFFAEASVVGVIGGGFGYLSGLGLYPLMAKLDWAPLVSQKVSALWCFATLAIALVSVIMGSMIALRRSVVVTPSLMRRWAAEGSPESHGMPWIMRMPILLEENTLGEFVSFATEVLRKHDNPLKTPQIQALKMVAEEGTGMLTINFSYIEDPTGIRGLKTFNALSIGKEPGEAEYSVELRSKGTEEATHRTGSFVRRVILDWNTSRWKRDDYSSYD